MIYPTIKQLRYFIALCEEGHFGRAAARSFVSQSAFSTAIQDLETLLGRVDGVIINARNASVGGNHLTSDIAAGLRKHRPALRAALLGVRDMVRDLQVLARQLRHAPSSLIYGADENELNVPASPAGNSITRRCSGGRSCSTREARWPVVLASS